MKTDSSKRPAWKSPARFGWTPIGIVAVSAGCVSLPEDCLDRLRCADHPSAPPLAFASGSGSPAAGAGGAGVAGGVASACVPSGDGSSVPDGCGIFVRTAGSDDNPGSRDAPVATIARAIELAANGPMRVYACAEVFAEAISLRAAIALHGGLACDSNWSFAGGTPTTLAPPRGVPLRLSASAEGATISDLTFVAPSGATPGESSIAVIAEGVTAELLRCALRAGRGADGAQGSSAPGIPGPGAGGNSAPERDGERCPASGNGEDGARGKDGAPGDGGTGLGQISAVGYRGVDGGAGRAGAPGQSGGSGSGGAGGRGGAGGGGGKAAGSSIALISLRAHLSLPQVTLVAADGGRGGKGGAPGEGGKGGAGGPGGAGVNAGCHGGRGGDGGKGGFGGGGTGGHSIGLAYTGLRPPIEDRAITLGKAGEGGRSAGNAGASGVLARQQGFD